MRKRFQKGSLRRVNHSWIAQWWDQGHRRKLTLGRVREMTKAEAQTQLAAILAPINARRMGQSETYKFGDFVERIYLPFFRLKWKKSTLMTNEARLRQYLLPEFGEAALGQITRQQLQRFLEQRTADGYSYSTVAHVRWDLSKIFKLARTDGYVQVSPAEVLFVPKEAHRKDSRVMTDEEVLLCLKSFDPIQNRRALLIVKLALLVGLRPGEILALRCGRIRDGYADIVERIYGNDLSSPKTRHSIRKAAIPDQLVTELRDWISTLKHQSVEAWVFPSENPAMPVSRINLLDREIHPVVDPVGLGWVNFQVFRRTHATLMRETGADPKLVADNMGHSVDVNQNVYTQTPLPMRQNAVEMLAKKVYG